MASLSMTLSPEPIKTAKFDYEKLKLMNNKRHLLIQQIFTKHHDGNSTVR